MNFLAAKTFETHLCTHSGVEEKGVQRWLGAEPKAPILSTECPQVKTRTPPLTFLSGLDIMASKHNVFRSNLYRNDYERALRQGTIDSNMTLDQYIDVQLAELDGDSDLSKESKGTNRT